MKYPEAGYIARDSLDNLEYPYDWHGDSPFTNFIGLFVYLRSLGYHLEILQEPLTAIDPNDYSALLIVDPERAFTEEEINHLEKCVKFHDMGLIVFADWFDLEVMATQTYKSLKPLVGGSNIPSLNDLLSRWGIGLASNVVKGDFLLEGKRVGVRSGSYITEFPKGGYMLTFEMKNESKIILEEGGRMKEGERDEETGSREEEEIMEEDGGGREEEKLGRNEEGERRGNYGIKEEEVGMIGFLDRKGEGRVSVFGDSACLDDSEMTSNCFWMLGEMLNFIKRDKISFLEEFENYKLPLNFRYKSQKPLRSKDWKESFLLQPDAGRNNEGNEEDGGDKSKGKKEREGLGKEGKEEENNGGMKKEEEGIEKGGGGMNEGGGGMNEEDGGQEEGFVYEWKTKRRKVGRDVIIDDFMIIQLVIGGICLMVVFVLICLVVGKRRRKKDYIPLSREERSKTFLV